MKFYFLTTKYNFLTLCVHHFVNANNLFLTCNKLSIQYVGPYARNLWAAVLYTRSAFQPKFSVFVYLHCRHTKTGCGICSVLYSEYKEIFSRGPRGMIHPWRTTTSLPRTVVIACLPMCLLEHPWRGVQERLIDFYFVRRNCQCEYMSAVESGHWMRTALLFPL
jgi:hypothetical protein